MPADPEQFLTVVDCDEADRRWRSALPAGPLGAEVVALGEIDGRVLAADVVSAVDVPAFDRADLDGFAVRAADTFGAVENDPRVLVLNPEALPTGVAPRIEVLPGTATPIATGAMLPRGADAVLKVEWTGPAGGRVLARHAVAPGVGVTFAGTDVARGELALRRGTRLGSREAGVLAAIGRGEVAVVRRPRVAVASTGDELIPAGAPPRVGSVYDCNAPMLAHACREAGAVAEVVGIVGDDPAAMDVLIDKCLSYDLILLSGGTSKGEGDVSYRSLAGRSPGVLVHGVALKPGKPVCLGAVGSTPVAILPGFPTSAIFTFHEFVAPLLRRLGGLPSEARSTVAASMGARLNSERGRAEYALVRVMVGPGGPSAHAIGKGSGSVSAFARADGFVVVPKHREYVPEGEAVEVVALGDGPAADLMVVGSHCVGLEMILGRLADAGVRSRTHWVGSTAGLSAAARGECDLAGIHLLDPSTGRYNDPMPAGVALIPGYRRMQGLIYRRGDGRFEGRAAGDAVAAALADPRCLMVNRNRGSGTRALLDGLLGGARPPGHAVEARSHNAAAAAVAGGRADWGVAVAHVAGLYDLAFIPLRDEHYDFAAPADRLDRPPLVAFREALDAPSTAAALASLGLTR